MRSWALNDVQYNIYTVSHTSTKNLHDLSDNWMLFIANTKELSYFYCKLFRYQIQNHIISLYILMQLFNLDYIPK